MKPVWLAAALSLAACVAQERASSPCGSHLSCTLACAVEPSPNQTLEQVVWQQARCDFPTTRADCLDARAVSADEVDVFERRGKECWAWGHPTWLARYELKAGKVVLANRLR